MRLIVDFICFVSIMEWEKQRAEESGRGTMED